MSLPKIPNLVYEIVLPVINEKIKFRPFVVREYKALLFAQEMGDESNHVFTNTISNILTDCTFNKIDIDNLPMYLIDYLFMIIRAKSVSEIIDASYVCNNPIKKYIEASENEVSPNEVSPNEVSLPKDVKEKIEPCGTQFPVQINLMNTFVKFPPNYNQKCVIKIDENIGMRLKSPSFEKFKSVGIEGKGIFDITDEYIYSCIECVFDGDKILKPGVDFTFEELSEFIGDFPSEKINQITEFFKNQPHICLEMVLTCPTCNYTNKIELNSVKDFFD